ncbi:unnamed protein product, partial [Urochloa humidicola]
HGGTLPPPLPSNPSPLPPSTPPPTHLRATGSPPDLLARLRRSDPSAPPRRWPLAPDGDGPLRRRPRASSRGFRAVAPAPALPKGLHAAGPVPPSGVCAAGPWPPPRPARPPSNEHPRPQVLQVLHCLGAARAKPPAGARHPGPPTGARQQARSRLSAPIPASTCEDSLSRIYWIILSPVQDANGQ